MFTIENHVGRLLEVRMESPIGNEELADFHNESTRVVSRIQGPLVVCTDLLGARVFEQAVTKSLTGIIKQDGPRVERNGFLVGAGAVFSMQIERIIREARAPGRRTFRAPQELVAWLGESLTTGERSRLDAFLREGARRRPEPER